MTDKYKFLVQSLNLLDELKNSLTKEEKTILQESLETTLDIDIFIEKNIDEIVKFLSKTPKQRISTKKWQHIYIPLTYGAYLVHLENFYGFILPHFRFLPTHSYRENISKIARLTRQNPYDPANLFFDNSLHNKQA